MSHRSLKAVGLSLLFSSIIVDAAPTDSNGVDGVFDAFASRGGVVPLNKLGTSLVDFTGCKNDKDNKQKDFIKAAYKEAHTIINVNGVKNNIRWDSEAAVEFFGPPQNNKNEQSQIQAVLANVETMQDVYWFNPFGHSLQVRCDDPNKNCARGVTAYTVNPKAKEKPYIVFCPRFFAQYTLEKAVNNYKDDKNQQVKWNVDNYMNRGLVFLHELFHLDLAADSEKGTPNPKIYDIYIWYKDAKGNTRGPERAYEASLSKVLARFLPRGDGKGKTTGYWVQRNVDNFSRFAMAKYLEGPLGGYPFLPMVTSELVGPQEPKPRQGKSSFVTYKVGNGTDAELDLDLDGIDEDVDGQIGVDSTHTTNEEFHVGEPIPDDAYPDSYKQARAKWLAMLKGNSDGTCKVEVKEIWTCEDVASNLYAAVKITDSSGRVVYTTPQSTHSPGQPINDAHPLEFHESGMDQTLSMVGEHTNDYIQFHYGSKAWTSGDRNGDASCQLVGSDWDKSGPKGCPNGMAVTRTFDCKYPCAK